jgi:hypothetical protein
VINALRYGFASFLSFSKPFTFLLLSIVSSGALFSLALGPAQGVLGQQMSILGAQTLAMNALILLFVSVPVAGQFAQEYRFKTLGAALLAAPQRVPLFLAKNLFGLIYVAAVVAANWLFLDLFGRAMGLGNQGTNYSIFALTGGGFSWRFTGLDAYWRMMLYIFGYMLIVIALSIVTRSQTLGILIPFFYLGIIETLGAISDGLVKIHAISGPFIAGQFRFFNQGQAWINADAHHPSAGLVYFGVAAGLFALSVLLFARRDVAPQ